MILTNLGVYEHLRHCEDFTPPQLSGSYINIDQFGAVTTVPIEWEWFPDGTYREKKASG
ncbi:MAG: hypothetical protein U9Q07_03770 [Planctomycetota bacterium]|nr:hypothetical protein [Planctomycetota bacterium]